MVKVQKVLVYWEGDDSPYEMTRQEFKDQVQGAYTAHIDPTVSNFFEYFATRWENGEYHE